VRVSHNVIVKRHIDQMIRSDVECKPIDIDFSSWNTSTHSVSSENCEPNNAVQIDVSNSNSDNENVLTPNFRSNSEDDNLNNSFSDNKHNNLNAERRYPSHNRRPPQHYVPG